MCFSAMVKEDLQKLERLLLGQPDWADFETLYAERVRNPAIKTPKAVDANFLAGGTPLGTG